MRRVFLYLRYSILRAWAGSGAQWGELKKKENERKLRKKKKSKEKKKRINKLSIFLEIMIIICNLDYKAQVIYDLFLTI
jgi:hypothetical protein